MQKLCALVAGMLRHIPVVGEENAGWQIRLTDMDIVHDWQGAPGTESFTHPLPQLEHAQ